MGYSHPQEQRSDSDSSHKTLKQQVAEISFDAIKKIKLFSLFVRFFISALMFAIIGLDIYLGVYNYQQSYSLVAILLTYTTAIFIFIQKTKRLDITNNIHNYFDFIYVTMEILAVYLSILIFPTHLANIYSNSLRGFWYVLIVLSVFTGRWYYGFYTGFLIAILNLTFLYSYGDVVKIFAHHGLDFNVIIPSFQVLISSVYYLMTGAFVSFPFYLFHKAQRMSFDANVKSIVAQPYYELSMQDSDEVVGDYIISKIVTSIDVVGADYVCLKKINSEEIDACMIIGDTIGHGLNRSPGAIITMSAFMSCLSNDSYDIQKSINNVLLNINKESGGKTYCLSLVLKKNGIVEYSGKAESFRYVKHSGRKLSAIDINQSGEILGIKSELEHTFKQEIKLELGDMIMVQTDGAVFDNADDDKTIVMISRKNHLAGSVDSIKSVAM